MKSTVIGLRCDIRSVATLALYWQERTKSVPKHIGSLMRDTVESLAESIAKNHSHMQVNTVEEAKQILDNLNLTPRSAANRKSMLKGMEADDMKFEAAQKPSDQEFIDAFNEAQKRLNKETAEN